MSNKFLISSLVLLAFVGVVTVHAEDATPSPRTTVRQAIKEEIKEKVVNKFPRAAIGTGTLKSLDGANLMVDKDGKTYTVQTGKFDKCTTKIVRRFGGESSLSELTIGDQLGVVGRFTDDTKTTITACVIRDLSIQKRFGTFVGDVKSLSPLVITTIARDDQTVTIAATTKLVNRRGSAITQADILVGHRVLVRGLWNRVNNTITETTVIRDYSLPVKTAPTPTTTP